MRKSSFTVINALFIWIITACLYVNADEPGGVSATNAETLTYVHLYTDAKGMTHFRDERYEFHSVNAANSPASMSYHELAGVQSASLVEMKKGEVEDWHNAPRTQFAIVIQGEVEVTAGDGEVRRLSPGNIALLDDTAGKGHKTASVGVVDHIALMIPIKD